MGTTQGRILLPSLNLSFGGHIHGQYRELDHVSRNLVPPPRKDTACVVVFGGEPLEFEPTLPHQGHGLDAEKVLVDDLFLPSAAVPPLISGSTASRTLGV